MYNIKRKFFQQAILFITINTWIFCDNDKKYYLKSQNINVSTFKNAIKNPNYFFLNDNIVTEFNSFIKKNIFESLYFATDKDRINKLIDNYICDTFKSTTKQTQKRELYNKLNDEINGHLFLRNAHHLYKSNKIYSDIDIKNTCKDINNHFINIGFLDSTTDYTTFCKDNEVFVTYNVTENKQYTINSINVVAKNENVKKIIEDKIRRYNIKNRHIYNRYKLETIKEECVKELRNNGYFNFTSDNLKIILYKNSINLFVDIYFYIANDNETLTKKYNINSISINYKSDINNKSERERKEIIYNITPPIKKKIIQKLIRIKPGILLNEEQLTKTSVKLIKTGIFKSVNINSELINDQINTNLNLLLKPRFSLNYSCELNINNKNTIVSNSVSILQRNIFKSMEIIKASINYSKTIPHKIKQFSILKLYDVGLSIEANYPYSLIFGNICSKTGSAITVKKTVLSKNNLKNKLELTGNFFYNFDIKDIYSLNPKLTFLNIEQKKKNYTQSKYITIESLLNIHKIYIQNFTVDFCLSFTDKKLIFFYKYISNGNYNKNLNIYVKLLLKQEFKIPITRNIELSYILTVGDIIKIRKNVPVSKMFQIGGNEILRAWDKGKIGPGYCKTGRGTLLCTLTNELKYKITENIHSLLFIDTGNIWTQKKNKKSQIENINFKNIYKQLYLCGGGGLITFIGILKLRVDVAFKFYSPNKKTDDELYKVRVRIN